MAILTAFDALKAKGATLTSNLKFCSGCEEEQAHLISERSSVYINSSSSLMPGSFATVQFTVRKEAGGVLAHEAIPMSMSLSMARNVLFIAAITELGPKSGGAYGALNSLQ